MNLAPITRFVAYAHFSLALAMIVPAIMAAWAQNESQVSGFVLGGIVASLIGALSLALGQGMKGQLSVRGGLRELMLALLIFWSLVPLSGAIPFRFVGETVGAAWFDAVSALTTRGGWLSDPAARATKADMLYRASLQWMGGLVSLSTAAAVFVRPEFMGSAPLVPPFSRGEGGTYLRAFDRAVWAFLPIYALIAALGSVALIASGVPMAEGVTMALSFLASGGFIPVAGGMEAFGLSSRFISCLLMTLGAINFVVIASYILKQSGRMRSGRDQETVAFLMLIPLVTIIFWMSRGAGDMDLLFSQMFNAISLLSTNGQTLGEAPSLTPVLVTAIIGGAAVSTAGGIKLLRWLVTFQRTSEELWKLINPGAVFGKPPSTNELGIWIHSLAFAILLASFVLITAFYGYPLEVSAAAAVAVISNTGPLLDLAPQMTGDFLVFDDTLRFIFGMGMIAGRLELVIMLVIINRRFWQG
ncbi:MAG: potassium transporter TrkG [Pseudomonadota bacterium]